MYFDLGYKFQGIKGSKVALQIKTFMQWQNATIKTKVACRKLGQGNHSMKMCQDFQNREIDEPFQLNCMFVKLKVVKYKLVVK